DSNHAEAIERVEGSALRGVDGLVDLLNLINGQDRQAVERGRVQINTDQLEHLVNGVRAGGAAERCASSTCGRGRREAAKVERHVAGGGAEFVERSSQCQQRRPRVEDAGASAHGRLTVFKWVPGDSDARRELIRLIWNHAGINAAPA